MFFCSHTVPEQKALGTSRSNPAEIKKITEVASHLLKYDYSPDHITVLCAYRGQVKKINKNLKCFMSLFFTAFIIYDYVIWKNIKLLKTQIPY